MTRRVVDDQEDPYGIPHSRRNRASEAPRACNCLVVSTSAWAAAAADNAARSRLDLDVSAGPIGTGDQPSSARSTTFRHPGYVVTASLPA